MQHVWGRGDVNLRFWCGSMRVREKLEDLEVDRRKWICVALVKMRWIVNSVHSGSIKCEKFLDSLRRSKIKTKHVASCTQSFQIS